MPDERESSEKSMSLAERLLNRRGDKGAALLAPLAALPQATSLQPKTAVEAAPTPPPAAMAEPDTASSPRHAIEIDFNTLREAGFITPNSPPSPQIESFRIIKRHLLKLAFQKGPLGVSTNNHVLMVTSSVPGEGKTFTALNLALSFSAERDLFVLLIDADSHRRSLGKLLGMDQEIGLVDLLAEHKVKAHEIIHRTNLPNLSFMPAGRPHPHGPELLSSKQMIALMRDIGARYADRVIIIDTSPVLATTEGLVLSSYAGQALVVVEKDVTTKKDIQRTLKMLHECPNVSCVLNKVSYDYNNPEYIDFKHLEYGG